MFAYSLPHPPWRGERVVVTVVRAFKGCGIPDVPSWERGPITARSACLLLQMEELRPRVTCLRCPSRARTQCLHHPLQHQVVVEVEMEVEARLAAFSLAPSLGSSLLALLWPAQTSPAHSNIQRQNLQLPSEPRGRNPGRSRRESLK